MAYCCSSRPETTLRLNCSRLEDGASSPPDTEPEASSKFLCHNLFVVVTDVVVGYRIVAIIRKGGVAKGEWHRLLYRANEEC